MELYRKELKLAVIKGLDESRGSSNVPIKLTHDTSDEYINYTEQIHVRYLLDNQVKEEILPTNGSGFYIPGKPLSHDGPIELAVHLINGDIELVTNELSFIVKNAPNGATQVDPSEFTWQQLVDQYVNAKLDTFADKADMNEFKDDVNANLTNQNSKITTLESRMDTFTSLKEGSTTGDAELTDVRVGADGTKYTSAGEAVREQVGKLKEDLVKHDISIGDLKTGYFINKLTGNESESSSYKCTDFINVSAYTKLELRSIMGEDNSSICFYDDNKIFITGYNLYKTEGPYVHTVDKPFNAKYARVTYNVSQTTVNSPYLKAVGYIDSINDSILKYTDWIELNCSIKKGKFVNKNNGVLFDSSDTVVGMLDVRNISRIYIHNIYLAGDRCICGYDSNNKFIESIDSGYAYVNSIFDKEYDVENYSYIAFSAKDDFYLKVLPKSTVINKDFSAIKNVKNNIVLPKHDKLHVYYEFKFGDITLPTDSTTTKVELFSGYGGLVEFATLHKKMTLVESYITAPVTASILNKDITYDSNQNVYIGNKWTNHIRGNNAFSIRCTDTSKQDMTMTIGAEGVVFTSGGTIIDRVECDAGTTINSLINELKKISYLDVILIEAVNHKYGDLLVESSVSIPMFYEFKKLDNSMYIDNPYISIPYKTDKTWHSLEAIIDNTAKKSYFAIDGLTCMSDISNDDITDYTMMIGKDVAEIRNIVIDVDTLADCEIVESEAPPYGKHTQLISNHNPRLLIFEGHGISVRSDNSAPVEDLMEVSTDRLRTVIEYLEEHKYVPVSFHDIVEWKLGNKMLPKRCYNMMFDDWRLSNYIDYDKRLPFKSTNLCAGLAVVSSLKSRDDTENIGGITYNVGDMVDITMRAGWYPCSHTYNHAELLNRKVSEVDSELEKDIRSAETLGIYSDVLVYPQGSYEIRYRAPMENSAFKIGINIVTDNYNCRGLSDYSLTRVEIGSRETFTNVLKPIV